MKKPKRKLPWILTLTGDLYADEVDDSPTADLVHVGKIDSFEDGEFILEAVEHYPECIELLHYALRIGVATPGPFSRQDEIIRRKIQEFLEEIGG